MTILQPVETFWKCPTCGMTDKAVVPPNGTRMHVCQQTGLVMPLVEVATWDQKPNARHVIVEREDYVDGEDVQYYEGRPLMAVQTDKGDGRNDRTVFAPTAHTESWMASPRGALGPVADPATMEGQVR